jgi:peptidoglycan/xylan/chitin deacetylase (PgdA/CDA1 family)
MATPPESHFTVARRPETPRPVLRLMKFGISLAFYSFSEAWRVLLKFVGITSPPSAVAIYYHHALDEHREAIRRQLDHLMRWTTPLPAGVSQSLKPGSRYSIVTADDGWKSFADNAMPELKGRNIPVALFAVSGLLGRTVNGIAFDRLLTPDELRGLKSELLTVGSHTASHASMLTLSDQVACRELRESRDELAMILHEEIKIFCFPYGEYTQQLIRMCRDAGYDRVFTCMPELANPSAFVMGRVRVDPTDWPLEFHLKLMGAYRWEPIAIAFKRRILSLIHGSTPISRQLPSVRAS